MKFGVIVFPGSNCDQDCFHVVKNVMKQPVKYIWHAEKKLDNFDCLILPGGFSYGDYLRSGAIARFAPIMEAVKKFAGRGGRVIGICNGFQILCEAGLLPGALHRNKNLNFICKNVRLKVENNHTIFTKLYSKNQIVTIPIAHADGNYIIDPKSKGKFKVVFTYHGENPNGSEENIAGIINKAGNILGMMPHPERVAEGILGGTDGRLLFESLLQNA
ncbi:phosphoribosylformylglycinamidine synthase I [candidate division WOR-1 bacterium RIFOXYA12_FULL_43_27]|uniref:Phosphoribosylformylglycinamidine synthase subunit PurQ n=1 Tax=candidate division WOR-1 bacterium RIFOXYC2_FULL_46_14 TaxID=1802587 RepID=A0A1F4U8C4_UNCSA|nr:MAG: phosphoribosylformylglycinamidine synthase I [candidate division WOR-1 bacterium RIFOXYA12_FULL_43_27]OGC20041.1 MAG: phosphoribosylformylglycinamidine synthase I [candidate division WOR-1 bacterium RIFOXYB2_FULL_46_45]OGC32223.1 MAG: phosphoribosylformylglycinamidine synthase I [candidate division WOR-1 bacterium RIFOXYA2_FULL_46_56]OGC41127.1 MAG: phosphoribosylformylglycinamidine synthase I [candidate division WOR-1 bacterium RIFOXYC2_FULL_46_14]